MATAAIETQGSKLGIKSNAVTASVSFDATTKKITRATGSFITDGFTTDMVVTTTDPTNPGPFTVDAVTALDITVAEALTTDAVAASFILTGYTRVRGISSFSGFDGKAAEIDTTDLDSTAKEYMMGLQDFGSFSVDVSYLEADPGQVLARAAKASRLVQDIMWVFSDRSSALFQAYFLSAPISGAVDAKADGSFDMRITGAVQFVAKPA